MTNDQSKSRTQQTLGGDAVEIEPQECDYYPGCRSDGKYIARLLENYERMVDVPVCESCKDEILEYKDEDSVREMSVQEKWGVV